MFHKQCTVRAALALVGVCASLLQPTGAGAATPEDLPSAVFKESLGISGGFGSVSGALEFAPEDISLDVNAVLGEPAQYVGRVLTSATGPKLDIQVDASGAGGLLISGIAEITYGMIIERTVTDAPLVPVRVRTTVLAGGSVSGDAGGYIELVVPEPLGAGSRIYNCNIRSNHAGDPDPNGLLSEFNLFEQFEQMMPPNQVFLVGKFANVGARAGTGDFTGQASDGQIVGDPIFEIDPSFMVDYGGVPTPASSLYQIYYSPGIIPIVPEPATALLLLPLTLLVHRRR